MAHRLKFVEIAQNELEVDILEILPTASLGMTVDDIRDSLRGQFVLIDIRELDRTLFILLQENRIIKDKVERYTRRWK